MLLDKFTQSQALVRLAHQNQTSVRTDRQTDNAPLAVALSRRSKLLRLWGSSFTGGYGINCRRDWGLRGNGTENRLKTRKRAAPI
jgi:hypothetical protein